LCSGSARLAASRSATPLPIPLRLLLAAQPELVTTVLQLVQRVVTRHLLDQAGFKADEGHGGAVSLIQRFGSAANLNVHLHCLVLDGVYRCGADGAPSFIEVDAPTDDEPHTLLQSLSTRLMKLLTRRGVLVEEMGQTCLAEPDADGDEVRTLRPLQAAAVTYRIAFGPRAGQNVLTLRRARRGKLSQPQPRPEPRRPSQTPRPRAATQDRSRGGDARRFGATPSESGSTLRT
jgi:hypothetical protein